MLKFFFKEKIVLFTYSIFFLLLCFYYSTHLNFWGDESASLALAKAPVSSIIKIVDVHTPSYILLLKLILFFTDTSPEMIIVIRMIHAMFFLCGMLFGLKLLHLILGDNENKLSLKILCFATLLPSFLFYATNIRMYSALFLCQMWYLFTLVRYLTETEKKKSLLKDHWPILISSIFLVNLDYTGLLYFGIGSLFLFIKADKKDWQLYLFLLLPLLVFFIYLAPILLSSLKSLLIWPSLSSAPTADQTLSILNLLKKGTHVIRPFMDLSSTTYVYLFFPLISLFLYAILLSYGIVIFIKNYYFIEKKKLSVLFVLTFSFLWIITLPVGTTLTRLFLPSQFFMSMLIIYGLFKFDYLKKTRLWIYFIWMILANLYVVLTHIPHINSILPFQTVATQTLQIADQKQVNYLLISNNSLNQESVLYYMHNNMKAKNDAGKIHIQKLSENFSENDLPKKPFLFLSYMSENNHFIDPNQFLAYHRNSIIIKKYISLDKLPFNSFSKASILSQTKQSYAFILYYVYSSPTASKKY